MKKKDSIIKGIVNSVLPVILAFALHLHLEQLLLRRLGKVHWKHTGY